MDGRDSDWVLVQVEIPVRAASFTTLTIDHLPRSVALERYGQAKDAGWPVRFVPARSPEQTKASRDDELSHVGELLRMKQIAGRRYRFERQLEERGQGGK